ncbi:MAG: DUF1016 family protein [Bacteroidales bacterium]|jgi:predicted nuclease of restriction endonuclease-like (RecB) superfamily|nr:DUF1016 family protein [Bacteroidales bacterium]
MATEMTKDNNIIKSENNLFDRVASLIENARKKAATTVNSVMVYTYYGVGKYIVEFEQNGKVKADYGKQVLINLSLKLTDKFGEGWSEETLKKCRKFFTVYVEFPTPEKILTASTDSVYGVDQIHKFSLSWNHYQILMRVKNESARSFYEIEAYEQQWSVRQLQRQVSSSLFERLALSRDKNEVLKLATEGQKIEKPDDILKDPLVLEFVGLKSDTSYSETALEGAIISKMKDFLLELGKGFLFEARQKRFTFDEEHFYVDLVFYNRLLQCYVLIDLKTGKLTHQDLGQMQMYVNYFDRYAKQDFEKPTIGILLCETKNDALVELTLPKDANIYAQQYAVCLPDKKLLQNKLREWIAEYNQQQLSSK